MNTYLLYGTLAFYLASTLCYLIALITERARPEKWGYFLLLPGFILHIISLIVRYAETGCTPVTNFHESLSFLALCIAGFFLYIKRAYEVRALGSIMLPLTCIILIWSFFYPARIRLIDPNLNHWWLAIHVISTFLGNAVFFVSFFVSVLYLAEEREIKGKKRLLFSVKFPSLETLDGINSKCMSYGFPLLTIGIITGFILAGSVWKSYWNWDPKEAWSIITWIVYAVVVHNRFTLGWRGRRTAYMMIIGFIFVLMTFLGVNFILKGLHTYV